MARANKVQPGESVDDWLDRLPEEQQTSLRWLRSLLLEVPGLVEAVKWAHPYYELNGVGLFSLTWSSKHVNMQLWRGAHLPNPHGVIEGTGKDARHVKVRNGKERPVAAVHDAIADSVALVESAR